MKKQTLIFSSALLCSLAGAQQQGIINNAESPNVKQKSINIGYLPSDIELKVNN